MIDILLTASIYTLLIGFVIYFGYRNVSLKRSVAQLVEEKLQLAIDRNIFRDEYLNALRTLESMKLEKSDDFVKFLSDSRDWAFEYIEQTQAALAEFEKVIVPIIKWSETYGTAVNNNTTHAEKLREISKAYEDLKVILPENNETPNN